MSYLVLYNSNITIYRDINTLSVSGIPIISTKAVGGGISLIEDILQINHISKCNDGSFIVTFQYELTEWIFNYLLSFGKYVEIIEPEIAREMLKKKALEIVELYN